MNKEPPSQIGARRRSEISDRVLEQLNRGHIESRTLVEVLAIDFAELLVTAVPDLPAAALARMRLAGETGVTQRMATAGALLLEHLGPASYLRLARHRSDTVRGWAAYLLATAPGFSLGERLRLIRTLANDHNAGVREWAWLAMRGLIAADIAHTIGLLEPWTVSTSPFLRRFASEATRPRGVWCAHIEILKRDPELGLPVIEPLRADPHKYVQDSVANWLNDAGKSQPAWVRQLCARWQRESPGPATARICRRAQRHLLAA
jgi:3-methyladenine DNA glycosylase AlkC